MNLLQLKNFLKHLVDVIFMALRSGVHYAIMIEKMRILNELANRKGCVLSFAYTAPVTSQQSGFIEWKFATIFW